MHSPFDIDLSPYTQTALAYTTGKEMQAVAVGSGSLQPTREMVHSEPQEKHNQINLVRS
jgi:hypothetical protein